MSFPRRGGVLIAAALVLALLWPLPALAADVAIEDPVELGLEVTGSVDADSTTVPVLPGFVPVALRTTFEGPTGALLPTGGYTLTVGTSAVVIDAKNAADLIVPLNADSVENGQLNVKLTVRVLDDLGCPNQDLTDRLKATVDRATITYSGQAKPPTSPADFFTRAVRQVTLVTDSDQVPFTAAAVLQAAATLGTSYPLADVSVGRAVDAGPFARIVEFVPAAGPVVVSVDALGETPTMELRGDAAALVKAAAALGSDNLALASDATADDLGQTGAAESPLTVQWAEVGAPSPSLTGLGSIDTSVTLFQTRFGGPISELDIVVRGVNQPVPAGATATVSLLVNGRLRASQLLGDTDTYNLTTRVGPEDVQRQNQVTVQVDSTPVGGVCGGAVWVPRVDIDAIASTFTATPGQSLPPGFTRFPQALRGELPVAFAKGPNPTDLANAAFIVASVSRLEVNPPAVTVVAAEELASASRSGLMVNAGPEESSTLGAPLPFDPSRAPTSTPPDFSVTIDNPFAAFESFENNGRDLLMLGAFPADDVATAAELQALLAEAIAPAPGGWYDLSGDTMFIGEDPLMDADGDLVATFLSIDRAPAQESDDATPAAAAVAPWLAVAGLILALLGAVAAVLWLLSRRRGNRAADTELTS